MSVAELSPPRRSPSGRKYSPRADNPGTLWRRIEDNWTDLEKLGTNANFGSQVGKLKLFNVLSESQASAAVLVGDIVGRFDRYHGQARRMLASASYERGWGRADEVERHAAQGTLSGYERRAKRAKRTWERLQRMMPSSEARDLVERLCVEDQHIAEVGHAALKTLLGAVAIEFGLVTAKRTPPRPSVPRAESLLDNLLRQFSVSDRPFVRQLIVTEPSSMDRQITLIAMNQDGSERARQSAVVRLGVKLLASELSFQLLEAGKRRGWRNIP